LEPTQRDLIEVGFGDQLFTGSAIGKFYVNSKLAVASGGKCDAFTVRRPDRHGVFLTCVESQALKAALSRMDRLLFGQKIVALQQSPEKSPPFLPTNKVKPGLWCAVAGVGRRFKQ
jgi:hypothetical protein